MLLYGNNFQKLGSRLTFWGFALNLKCFATQNKTFVAFNFEFYALKCHYLGARPVAKICFPYEHELNIP